MNRRESFRVLGLGVAALMTNPLKLLADQKKPQPLSERDVCDIHPMLRYKVRTVMEPGFVYAPYIPRYTKVYVVRGKSAQLSLFE